jgi:hypothetical protein
MKIFKFRDKNDGGFWIMILGCPLPEKHNLYDEATGKKGPSYAQCSQCEHQIGINFEILGADGEYDGSQILPERLMCRKLELTDVVALLIEQEK